MNRKIMNNDLALAGLNVMLCAVLWAAAYLFQYYFPVAYSYFIAEDSLVEYGTFVFSFMAGLFVLGTMKADRSLRHPGYGLLCLVLFLVAFEEISWGQRFFGIHTPFIIAKYNYQSELTLHNMLTSTETTEYILSWIILVWAVVAPVIYRLFRVTNKLFDAIGVPLVPLPVQPFFIFAFLLKNFPVLIKHYELGEMFFGLSFLLLAVDIWYRSTTKSKKRGMSKGRVVAVSLLTALAATFGLTLWGPDNSDSVSYQMHEFAAVEYPRWGMNSQAERIYEYLIGHKELAKDNTLYEYGLLLGKLNDPETKTVLLKALDESKERMLAEPDKASPQLMAGRIYRQLGMPDQAAAAFATALEKDRARLPAAREDWEKAMILQSMGETYFEMGDPGPARSCFREVLQLRIDGGTRKRIEDLLRADKLRP